MSRRLVDALQEGTTPTFPLYTEAIKFINHRDGLVRAAVRTLTLSVYSIKEPAVQAFVVEKSSSSYFKQLLRFLTDLCQVGMQHASGHLCIQCLPSQSVPALP